MIYLMLHHTVAHTLHRSLITQPTQASRTILISSVLISSVLISSVLISSVLCTSVSRSLASPLASSIAHRDDCPALALIVPPVMGTPEHLTIHGRVIKEERRDLSTLTPRREISVDEAEDIELRGILFSRASTDGSRPQKRWQIGEVRADDEGEWTWTGRPKTIGIPAGRYRVEWWRATCRVGVQPVRLLDNSQEGVVIRSDIDLTYLQTDFETLSGLWGLFKASGMMRVALPGMPALYRDLQRGPLALSVFTEGRPLSFFSGSPQFFLRPLLTRFLLDELDVSTLTLKPFKSIMARQLFSLRPHRVIAQLKEQIGYKLSALLEARATLPPKVTEALLGDDVEADPTVYRLYEKLTSGAMKLTQLEIELTRLKVQSNWRSHIAHLAKKLLAQRPPSRYGPAVYATFIHQKKKDTHQQANQGQPKRCTPTQPRPRLYYHCGAPSLKQALRAVKLLGSILKKREPLKP